MKNKYGVKITAVERKYFNSLKQSIRRSTKAITNIVDKYTPETYLRRKSKSSLIPTVKKTTVHSFQSREDFLKEVERLTKQKSELSLIKPRKPSYIEELPKRLQKSHDTATRQFTSRQRNMTRDARRMTSVRSVKSETQNKNKTSSKRSKAQQVKVKEIERLLKYDYVNAKNELYRENIIKSIIKVYDTQTALKLADMLNGLTEEQFLNFILSRNEEITTYNYKNPTQESSKALSLEYSIIEAKRF